MRSAHHGRRYDRRASASGHGWPCRAGSWVTIALHRVEHGIDWLVLDQVEQRARKGSWDDRHRRVRIAKVPGEAIHVAEDMAGRTGRVSMTRRERCVIEEAASRGNTRGLGVVQQHMVNFCLGDGVDDADRVVEPRQHVEPVMYIVEHQPGRPSATHRDMVRSTGNNGVILEGRSAEHPNLVRAQGSHDRVAPSSLTASLGVASSVVLSVRDRRTADVVVDMLVEMAESHQRCSRR